MTDEQFTEFISARRSYIASQFSNLNDRQMEGVLATEGPLLLLAGAGSGKTTVLIHRIANLIRYGRASDCKEIPWNATAQDAAFLDRAITSADPDIRAQADQLCAVEPATPWSILAITFTNKAANELKERLAGLLGDCARDIWAMTFHSACCRILRREITRLGYTSAFTIYDTADSERIMKDVIRSLELDDKTFPARMVLSVISHEKDAQRDPEQCLEEAQMRKDFRMIRIAKAYQIYEERLKANNALDFDNIIALTVKLLQENPDVLAYYQRKFRYVLVDEYQDTNHLQYLLTSLLAGGQENICVVGDDDQSIYRFRGATIENILSFEEQYPAARTIRLEQNYRSTQSILNAANAVIANNIGRKGKELWTNNGQGDPITVYDAQDEGAEGNFVAGRIIAGAKRSHFRDYAVLYRTNAQSNALEFAFKRNGIPYRVFGGTRFFDRAEIKDMLAYLCIINNRTDDLRLRRIINNPPRGIGGKTLEIADRLSQAAQIPLYSVISEPDSYAPLEKPAAKLKAFSAMIEDLASLLDQGISLPDFYEELMRRTGYLDMLAAKPTEENKTRLENIRELKSSIVSYAQSTPYPTLAGFLEEIALYTDLEQYNEGDDAVVLMTIHSAKGLEFPHVFLVGFEDGLFPGMQSIGDREAMEEERRLCYVAITRAKKTLTICHARRRMLYGRTSGAMPSRFLKEIPEDCIKRQGGYVQQSRTPPVHSAPQARHIYPGSWASAGVPVSASELPKLSRGDMVEHTAFGRGMVLTVLEMGGDALLEIAFDEIGTKKLMAKTAWVHMKKLS